MKRSLTGMALQTAPRGLSMSNWIVGGVSAVAIHVGCLALAAAHLSASEVDDDLGAPALAYGVEIVAPHLEQTDLPPGPEADASTAATAVAEQEKQVEETALPQAQAVETDDPDQQVSPEAKIKPEEKEVDHSLTQANASDASVASEATSAPSLETVREAPSAAAPTQGIGESAQRARATWQKQLVAHLDRNKRYPAGGMRRSAEIQVNFTLDRLGHVLSARVAKGSGDATFDEAALAMMQRADPVPKPPPLVADEGLNFTLPVIFRVKPRG